MITIPEGDKRDIIIDVSRLRGTGAITVATPQRRILDASRLLIAAFDWAAATWDGAALELYTLFDSTAVGLTAVGTYYVQFRGTIGTEIYKAEVTVRVTEVGP